MSIEEEKVCSLLKELGVKPELLIKENFNSPLTGKIFRLQDYELLYLYFSVKKIHPELSINEDSKVQKFNTISDIARLMQ